LGFGRRELSGIWVLRKGSLVIVVEEDRVVIGRRFHFLESEIAEREISVLGQWSLE
jgi:hypothetical protein